MSELAKLLDKASAAEAVNDLGEEDLRFLNRLIVNRLDFLQQVNSSVEMTKFAAGDRVNFLHNGGLISGVITRFNKKTVTVIADGGLRWTVPPRMLRLAGKSYGPAAALSGFLPGAQDECAEKY